MAPDRVKQLGKDFGKTYKSVDTSKKRYQENFPKLDRTRDLLANETPYELGFTLGSHNSAWLNIKILPVFDPELQLVKPVQLTISETGLPIGKPGEVGVCGIWYELLTLRSLNMANGPFTFKFDYQTYGSATYNFKISWTSQGNSNTVYLNNGQVTMSGGIVTITISSSTVGSTSILEDAYISIMASSCSQGSWIYITNTAYVSAIAPISSSGGSAGSTGGEGGSSTTVGPINDDTGTNYTPPTPPPPDPIIIEPGSGGQVTVSSISALKTALADNSVGTITVSNGTYSINTASSQQANSLWIDGTYANRTNPVLVRAATIGGVVFDGGGASYFGGLTFVNGAHHQIWDGFIWQNGSPTHTGVIVVGGYSGLAPPHDIAITNCTVRNTWITGGINNDHAIYYSKANYPGPYNFLIDNFTVTNSDLAAAHHFYHDYLSGESSDHPGDYNCNNVTIRRSTSYGLYQPIIIWAKTLQNVVIEDYYSDGAKDYGVRYEWGTGIVLRRVTTVNSRYGGFYSSKVGYPPAGVTFDSCSFN